MVRGPITRPVSIAAAQHAAPADTPQQSIAVTATRLALGASIATRNTDARKPAPAAACPLMTMPTTIIPTVRGCRTAKRSTSAQKRALLAVIPVMNMQTIPTRTATANVTTAVRPSV